MDIRRLGTGVGFVLALYVLSFTAHAQKGGLLGSDYIKINRGDNLVWRLDYDRLVDSLRNVSLFVDLALFDSRLSDSLDANIPRTQGGSSGRPYVTDKRNHAGVIDSTEPGLYKLDYGFGTLNYQGYANFSNNGAGGSDSTSFQLNGLALNGFMLPLDISYPVVFERFALKTAYTAGNAVTRHVFPTNIVASLDSSLFSVHIKTEYVAGTRYYYLRVYKLGSGTVNGLSIPHNAGTLVCSQEIPADRFPPYGTSVQVRIEIWIRRL